MSGIAVYLRACLARMKYLEERTTHPLAAPELGTHDPLAERGHEDDVQCLVDVHFGHTR